MVDTQDLKSCALNRREGSSPSPGTKLSWSPSSRTRHQPQIMTEKKEHSARDIQTYQEAESKKWTYLQWLRFNRSGNTPEDVAAWDNQNEQERENRLIEPHLHTLNASKQNNLDPSPVHAEAQNQPELNHESVKRNLVNSTKLLEQAIEIGLDNSTLDKILDDHFNNLELYDKLIMKNFGNNPLKGDPDYKDFLEVHRKLSLVVENVVSSDSLNPPQIKAKFLRNCWWMSFNDLTEYTFTNGLLGKTVQSADTKTIREILTMDEMTALATLKQMSPRYASNSGEKKGLPYYYELINLSREPIPDDVLTQYAEDLLPALTQFITQQIKRKGIEDAQIWGGISLAGGIMDHLRRHPDTLTQLFAKDTTLETLAEKLFDEIIEKNQKDYEISTTSDMAWQETIKLLKGFYSQKNSNFRIKLPRNLNREWIHRLINNKPREDTGAILIKFAHELNVDLH
jgi:hypothetical protein